MRMYKSASDKNPLAGKLPGPDKAPDATPAFRNPRSSPAPSRVGRVQLSVHIEVPVRKALRALAVELDVTLQHLMCRAINDLFEKYGRDRTADEGMLPRGGAAHKR
jgi:hypothetical protein